VREERYLSGKKDEEAKLLGGEELGEELGEKN